MRALKISVLTVVNFFKISSHKFFTTYITDKTGMHSLIELILTKFCLQARITVLCRCKWISASSWFQTCSYSSPRMSRPKNILRQVHFGSNRLSHAMSSLSGRIKQDLYSENVYMDGLVRDLEFTNSNILCTRMSRINKLKYFLLRKYLDYIILYYCQWRRNRHYSRRSEIKH